MQKWKLTERAEAPHLAPLCGERSPQTLVCESRCGG